jgi:hypothetical protein
MQVEGDTDWGVRGVSALEKLFYGAWSFMVRHPAFYRTAMGLAGRAFKGGPSSDGILGRRASALAGWTRTRDLPSVAAIPFRERWQKDLIDNPPQAGAPEGDR